jgi:4-phospho-D-threonate 3-dehydrogenase / 4-phospho-D-erythronate 3-dehydrogenase
LKSGALSEQTVLKVLFILLTSVSVCGQDRNRIIVQSGKRSLKLKIDIQGPFAADSVFATAFDKDFDTVVCMYHDQANIARRLFGKKSGASLFMGLQVRCATTAHGAVFDLAGKELADPASMVETLKYAVLLYSKG